MQVIFAFVTNCTFPRVSTIPMHVWRGRARGELPFSFGALRVGGWVVVMEGREGEREGSCGDFDFAQTEKRSGGKKGKNAKNDRWGRKKCGASASFIALFKSRRGTDQRLRGVEKEIRFSPPSPPFFSLFVTFLIRFSASRQI